jgi:C4-type Zn-finger protein
MTEKDVLCCPKCKRAVEAKDFLSNAALVGALDSILETINCGCGYRGLPIKLGLKDYLKWREG